MGVVQTAFELIRYPDRLERAVVVGTGPSPRAFVSAVVYDSTLVCAMGSDGNYNESLNFNDLHVLVPRLWSPNTHHLFPRIVQQRVYMWLLIGCRLQLLPRELWLMPLSFLSCDG